MKIGFIGCGNMASAMIGGILGKGLYQKEEIIASVHTKESRAKKAAALGIEYGAVRVHQIKAVKTLGSGKHRSILIHYSDDPYANAYKGGLNSFMVTQTSITEKIAMNYIKCHQDALMKISAFSQGRAEKEDGRE